MNIDLEELTEAQILLIDDISTTGATLAAASHALKRAGAQSVTALTAGLTPLGGHDGSPAPD